MLMLSFVGNILNIYLETPRFILRRLNSDDKFSNYLSWIRDTSSNPYIHGANINTELRHLKKYVAEKNSSKNALLLGIFLKQENTHIGNLKFEPIFEYKDATLGILIGETSWRGVGAGFEVISHALDFVFSQYNLKTIKLGVHPNNINAIKLYKKLGFNNYLREQRVKNEIYLELRTEEWMKRDSNKTL